jgi:surface carbohydrate biosynthesis protein (TIGR04326 family)
MKMDWRSSIIGKSAIHGLINFQLFKNSLADIPIQRKGFYLFENQSWERAFIFAWKKNGHDQLIGVAHSTIRYWDLRYFSDKRSINSITVKGNKMPQPDFVALNGPLALESFAQSGHPLNRTIECEAVRFMNLTNLKRKEKSVLFSDMLKVLILGEYMPSVTDKMLAKLEKVSFSIERMISYAFKPHPNYYINPNKYPGLNLSIVTESLDNVLTGYDIVISSNSTSAAVDAYLAGISLVIFLDKYELNYSPLRNQPGVRFIYSHEELEKVLNSEIGDLLSNNYSHSFFFLDPNLPKWKKILEN